MLPILHSRFDELERQRRALVDELLRHSPAQLQYRPAPGAWSLADLIQHLVLVEESTLEFLRSKPPRPASTRTLAHRIRWWMFAMVAPRPIRVRVPVAAVKPVGDVPVDALVARWDAVREQLKVRLESITEAQLPMVVMKHPIGGPLPMIETLQFIRLHLLHHGHQIRRIRSAPGWPAVGSALPRTEVLA